ncbi:MAG: PAS domain-containing protein [Caldilineaceae bacterium]|nr:PAS domain-containing protein [Caldilineaceae bacterium]
MTTPGRLTKGATPEELLRREEMIRRVGLILAYTDTNHRYTWIYHPNPDFDAAQAIGQRDDELQPNDAGREVVEIKQQVLESGRTIRRVITFPFSDGMRSFDMVFERLRNEHGNPIGVVAAAVNVTNFVAENRHLRETQALLKSLFDSAPVGLSVWDRDMRFLRLNQSLADMNGLPVGAHIGKRPSEILPQIKDIHDVEDFLRGVMESGEPAMDVEIYGSTPADPDTEHVWREHFYPIRLDEEVIGLGAVVEDITELKQAQESLHQARELLESQVAERTAQLSELNTQLQATLREQERTAQELAEVRRRLAQSREAERLRLAHELHDTAMQDLTVLTYDLVHYSNANADEAMGKAIANIRGKIGHINQTLRRIVGDLRPPILVDFGLKAAIEAHIERIHNDHPSLHITLEAEDNLPRLREMTAVMLFRIQQQALRNIFQHAAADRVWIRVTTELDWLKLEVEDNGKGFSIPRRLIELARQGHLGIVSMSERANEAGGVFEIESEPGKGTVVRVKVPVAEMNDER